VLREVIFFLMIARGGAGGYEIEILDLISPQLIRIAAILYSCIRQR